MQINYNSYYQVFTLHANVHLLLLIGNVLILTPLIFNSFCPLSISICVYTVVMCFFICAYVGVHICEYCMWKTEVDTRLHPYSSCTLFIEAASLHQTQRTTIWLFSLVIFLLGIPYLCLQSSIRGVHHTHLECEFCGSKIQPQVCLARILITEPSPTS